MIDYPSKGDLKKISKWDHKRFPELMEFVRCLWAYDFWECSPEEGIYSISTGGWSGNEDIVSALEKNRIFWSLCWQSSRRGGHYEFNIPKSLRCKAA